MPTLQNFTAESLVEILLSTAVDKSRDSGTVIAALVTAAREMRRARLAEAAALQRLVEALTTEPAGHTEESRLSKKS